VGHLLRENFYRFCQFTANIALALLALVMARMVVYPFEWNADAQLSLVILKSRSHPAAGSPGERMALYGNQPGVTTYGGKTWEWLAGQTQWPPRREPLART
jgi:hypothetical protein